MAIQRKRKDNRTLRDKENPHYNFLISWSPTKRVSDPEGNHFQARVKGELNSTKLTASATLRHSKKAESSAQEASASSSKRSIVQSLVTIGFVLILELVIYLAWNKFIVR
jgi:hypothetical protein